MNTQEQQIQVNKRSADFAWPLWPVVPLYPYGKRQTLRHEVVKDTIWTFDQIQGILYVVVPIRMTVVKLDAGGLLVYAPIAPTPECIRLVAELVAEHGDVRYIILPTISGIEHKVFVGPFARRFPEAQVYVAPDQWSFPLNLPLSWLGFPGNRTQILPPDSADTPFAAEFDYAILGAIDLGPGRFEEVAFFHRRSRTLLVTDSVLSIPDEPPAIVQLDPYPLLFHAKDTAFDPVDDTAANRRKGWQRIALFTFYFQPNALQVTNMGRSLLDALKAPDRSRKALFGWFPFAWRDDWPRSFAALRGNGRLVVAPILQTLILNRAPRETLEWVNQVASWDIQQIIPCHLDAPIKAGSQQFRQAFTFLEKQSAMDEYHPLPEEDFQLLQNIDRLLHRFRIVPPPQEKL
ncbi:DUF4336 domain-containing protein [Oculatella sp. LEGE 06141]|uniref:DUF4336 domain-containing protein n=1 Tax=Oculatella sp. LEGE 06141 TaxID=1828648 RepID=UPI00187EC7FC|nr:DUF4336 domain-containing protein [Oculatella sp. LEGE 06141]MBE9182128.1 DUF4336 domain-containing protein [Oculatella sp. LEGE 06141]